MVGLSLAGCFTLLFVFLLESCVSAPAVATFAANAEKAAGCGTAIFADIHGSCVRRHLAAAPVSPNFFPAALQTAGTATTQVPQCAAFISEGEALAKASSVLTAYLRAMQELASFNSGAVSGPSLQTGLNITAANGLNPTQIDSISKLAGVVSQIFTEGYRQRDLAKVLSRADPSIASVTQGFEDIVAKDYEGLLREEEQALPTQYQSVADLKDPAAILLLNRAFAADLAELNRRKAEAEAYVQALRQIREGHHLLVQMIQERKTKHLALALQPYTDKLGALLATLEKQQ